MRTLKVMTDYGCFPLWLDGDNVDPAELGLSDSLRADLAAWAATYDAILNWDDPAATRFPSPADEERFARRGLELAQRVAYELGQGYQILYLNDETTVVAGG